MKIVLGCTVGKLESDEINWVNKASDLPSNLTCLTVANESDSESEKRILISFDKGTKNEYYV